MRMNNNVATAFIALTLVMTLCGCGHRDVKPDIYFVRNGIGVTNFEADSLSVRDNGKDIIEWKTGRNRHDVARIGDDKLLVFFKWKPGNKYMITIGSDSAIHRVSMIAPLKPSPFRIAVIPLESVEPHGIGMGIAPDSCVKFSPDGTLLAIGTINGFLRIVDTTSGRIVSRRHLAEGSVKRIGWGKVSGKTVVYIGEQSPDGYLLCIEVESGRVLWKYRLADDIEYSSIEENGDSYSLYNLPGVYQLKVTDDGDLIAIGTHGWYIGEKYVYKCLVYRFDGATGKVKWKWPEREPLPFAITWFAAGDSGADVVLHTSTWLPVIFRKTPYTNGTVYNLDGETGKVRWEYRIPVLRPYYEKASSSGQCIGISRDGRHAVLGLNDGRGLLFDSLRAKKIAGNKYPVNEPVWVRNIGTPVLIGNIPVNANLAYAAIGSKEVYFGVPGSNIPPGAGTSRKQNAAPHPATNHVFAYGYDGRLRWKWHTDGSTKGVFLSREGRWAVIPSSADHRKGASDNIDSFEINVFDTWGRGGGASKLAWTYETEGPLYHISDITSDGRYVAAVETPYRLTDGRTVVGKYRVHIVH